VKPNINSVEVHPQLSDNRHPVDGALVGYPSPPGLHLICSLPLMKGQKAHGKTKALTKGWPYGFSTW